VRVARLETRGLAENGNMVMLERNSTGAAEVLNNWIVEHAR
jgi:hypothetical protein